MAPAEFELACEQIEDRITKIDKMFEEATGWGSWMSDASKERQSLVREMKKIGITIEDEYVLKIAE